MKKYDHREIEPKTQAKWDDHRAFASPEIPMGPKAYLLDMFPYPSAEGLHVGHPEGYTATDIKARFLRAKGFSVLHPMGFDSFGLPAEEFAIRTNVAPEVSTNRNIANFRRQLKSIGFSYDWDRELSTTDERYYRWTQWIFLMLFNSWFDATQRKARPIADLPIPDEVNRLGRIAIAEYQNQFRLAYLADGLVNWCPELGTVLANEEVIDGVSERGAHPVFRIPLKQWHMRITAYADRLLDDLEPVNWPQSIKKMQHAWIGKSTGTEFDFYVGSDFDVWSASRADSGFPDQPDENSIRVFTTRPDTIYGATYLVVAPEHPMVNELTTAEQKEPVREYCIEASRKSDLERTAGPTDKTGVFTGTMAINPINGDRVPVWVGDYVLASYGTGAIMAVPAHDDRDFDFALKYSLPILAVIDPGSKHSRREDILTGKHAYCDEGVSINSAGHSGFPTGIAKLEITMAFTKTGVASPTTCYKMRDWLFSRQRYWGEPIPVLHELDENGKPNGVMLPVNDVDLPLKLPELADYKPHGRPEPMLEKSPEEWLFVTIDGKRYKRETNTMPQWAGSCWYYLRFIDPKNDQVFVDPEKERAWMPVDLYVGGAEHAVLHLLYSRFWHKVLFDLGYVSTIEPFSRLVNQGTILGKVEHTAYQDEKGNWVSTELIVPGDSGQFVHIADQTPVSPVSLTDEQVTKAGENFVLVADPRIRVESRSYKMSKSRGNVVNPDDIIKEFGADTLRLYEMFMGPLEATKSWNQSGLKGIRGFLDRVWRILTGGNGDSSGQPPIVDIAPDLETNRRRHRLIKVVTSDIESLSFNTAIARMMEFSRFLGQQEAIPRQVAEDFLKILSPFAPHIAEELWARLGNYELIVRQSWPDYDDDLAVVETTDIPVQINGRLRGKICLSADAGDDEVQAAINGNAALATMIKGKQITRFVYRPGKVLSIVIR